MGHIGHGATGYVIEHHRQIDGFRNRFKMEVLAFLRGLVVVRDDLQLAVSADIFGETGKLDSLGCGVCTATGHDGHLPDRAGASLLDRDPNDLTVFFNINRRGLTRSAYHPNAIRPLLNMPVNEFAQTWIVHTAVFVHGR